MCMCWQWGGVGGGCQPVLFHERFQCCVYLMLDFHVAVCKRLAPFLIVNTKVQRVSVGLSLTPINSKSATHKSGRNATH